MDSQKFLRGTIWKFLERIGVFGTQFIVQIILARSLAPSDYGLLSIMLVFITISNVIIQSGFSVGLIQRKDVSEDDYSTVLWISLGIACFLYSIIYAAAPFISTFYKSTELTKPLRIIALGLFPGAINSIQLAKVSREFDFKKLFFSNVSGIALSGVIGIIIALNGGGIWSLVAQNVINLIVSCLVMAVMVKIKIRCFVDLKRIYIFLSYGWKLIISGVLNTISEQLNGLVIGYKYTTEALGFYSRGMQFPNYGITIIEGTMTGVLMPAISQAQEEKSKAKTIMRNAMLLTTYLVFPILGGLAVISHELILVLLTDKWVGCVPYLQIFCGVFAFYPVHVCNLQALNALGRSDLFLKLEIIKKIYSIILVILMIVLFDSPLAIAICTLAISPLGWFVNSYPNRKLLDYSFFEQLKDLVPAFINTAVMMVLVFPISYIKASPVILLIVKVIIGVISYILISIITKNKQFYKIVDLMNNLVKKCRRNKHT